MTKKYKVKTTEIEQLGKKKRFYGRYNGWMCCRPPIEEPIYDNSDPRHTLQRIVRNQIQTSYDVMSVFIDFPLSSKRTKTGIPTLYPHNCECIEQSLKTLIKISKKAKKNASKYALSYFRSFAERGKEFKLWPKTSLMAPYVVQNYSLAAWMKANAGGSILTERCEGVNTYFFENEVSDFVNFCYLIDDKSTVKHLNICPITSIGKVINVAINKAVDFNDTLQEEADSDGNSSSGSSDSDADSTDSEDDSDEEDNGNDGNDGNTDNNNNNNIDQKKEIEIEMKPFKLKRFVTAKKAINMVKKAFEKEVKACIKKYDERQQSKFRARMRLVAFNEEQNWYQDGSKYAIKPSQTDLFVRPFEEPIDVQEQFRASQRDLPD